MPVNAGLTSRLKIALPVTAAFTAAIFYAPTITIWFVIAVLLRSLWEFFNIFNDHTPGRANLTLAFAFLYLFIHRDGDFQHTTPLALLGFFGLFVSQLFFPSQRSNTLSLSQSLMGFVFVIMLGEYALRIYGLSEASSGQNWGARLLFATIFTCKFTDATAYFAGKNFGKKKLIPHISPNKTWEGLWGAYAGGLPCLLLFVSIPGFSLWSSILLCFFIISAATLGDLFESQFKRELKVKDTANDIPGFGGTLDMIDSLLWALPTAYWFVILYGCSPSSL